MAGQNYIEVDTRLGMRQVDEETILHFPRGLAGFEGLHKFTLLQIRPDSPLLLLQSLENAQLGLLVTDPYTFMDDYGVHVGEAEQKLLEMVNAEQIAILVTVTVPHGQPELTALNLVGPILINHEKRLGIQVPQVDEANRGSVLLSELSQAQADRQREQQQEQNTQEHAEQKQKDHE